MKICTKCKEEKELTEFSKSNKLKDGLSHWCKPCFAAYHNKWQLEHGIEKAAKMKRWRLEHPLEDAVRKNKYRSEHLAEIKARVNKRRLNYLTEYLARDNNYYKNSKDKVIVRIKKWRLEHPEKLLEYGRNRRALRLKAGGIITSDEWLSLCNSLGNRCLCCGGIDKLTMDHVVPLIKGGTHTIDNVQPLCKSCNCIKGTNEFDYRQNPLQRLEKTIMNEIEDKYLRMQIILAEAEKYARAFEIIPEDEKNYIRHLAAVYYAVFSNIVECMEGHKREEAIVLTLSEIAQACYMFGYTRRTSTTVSSKDSIIVNLN
jgi:5-methylcytosine-specific restriction endonuclease McrA